MFKIFITVFLAIIVGGIVLKYWKEILAALIVAVSLLISVVFYIVMLPVKLIQSFISDDKLEECIVKEYDWMFFEADTIEDVKKRNNTIKKAENILEQRKKSALYKKGLKILEESKYVL